MATPRIFVSSTCYDLNEVRDNLYGFIESLGYIPVFSDKNDVFYHPDLHSHEACIKEIENCQIFILVLGGRFGGQYIYDMEKSIVNAEYHAAKKMNIPIFTFVKREVYEDHRVFVRNKKEKPELYDQIEYPSIEKQDTVLRIFNFLDEVRKADVNNAFFTFEFSRDIRDILKKQLAGMFYDFLWNRKKEKEKERFEEMLTNLSLLGKKTEEIIENIYKKVDETEAQTEINKLDITSNASKFWYLLLRKFELTPATDIDRIKELSKVEDSENWIDFLTNKGRFVKREFETPSGNLLGLIRHDGEKYIGIESKGGDIPDSHIKLANQLDEYFNSFKELSEDERIVVISNLI